MFLSHIIHVPLIWIALSHKYQSYRPPEPLRLKEIMKFNQTSNELRLIDELVGGFWPPHLQVKLHRLSSYSQGEAMEKQRKSINYVSVL